MADGDPGSSSLLPQTVPSDGPTHQDPAAPVMTAGGTAILFVGIAVQYGFWIIVAIATGYHASTLRWSIPFMLISLTVCVLSAVAGTQMNNLSSYVVAKGRAKAGKAASVTSGVCAFLAFAGGVCAFVGFLISVVATAGVA